MATNLEKADSIHIFNLQTLEAWPTFQAMEIPKTVAIFETYIIIKKYCIQLHVNVHKLE